MRKAMIIGVVFGGLGVAPAAAKENHEARRVLATFAECVVKDSRAVTSRAIVEDWDSKALIEHKSKPISSSCLRGAGFIAQLRASPQMMKAAIAEQLVRRDKIVVQAADVAKLAPLNYRMPTPVVTVNARTGKPLDAKAIDAQKTAVAATLGAIALNQLGECVVQADPTGARSVLDTPIGKPEELAAINAITPVMGQCLPKDFKLVLDRSTVRSAVALSYYRMAMAARGTVWAGEASAGAGAAH